MFHPKFLLRHLWSQVWPAQVEMWVKKGSTTPPWKILPSLKLTVCTWKWMVGICWNTCLGWPIFRGHVSFRECTNSTDPQLWTPNPSKKMLPQNVAVLAPNLAAHSVFFCGGDRWLAFTIQKRVQGMAWNHYAFNFKKSKVGKRKNTSEAAGLPLDGFAKKSFLDLRL